MNEFWVQRRAQASLNKLIRHDDDRHELNQRSVTVVGDANDLAKQRQMRSKGIWRAVATGNLESFKSCEATENPNEVRGVFGETVLHAALLYGCHKESHAALTDYILEKYANLVNAAYQKEPYTGETALHMAIVNHDVALVKKLLALGAKTDCHATGEFFSTRGRVYFGELPLSFAACCDDREIVRILLDAGADLLGRDNALGNTVFHMMVAYNNMAMYDFLLEVAHEQSAKEGSNIRRVDLDYSSDGQPHEPLPEDPLSRGGELELVVINQKDQQGNVDGMIPLSHAENRFRHTPLTLAAELGRREMFLHLMNLERVVLWSYGRVRAVAYPLDQLDTHPDIRRAGRQSALELIVYLNSPSHMRDSLARAKLLDESPVKELLDEKWNAFAHLWFWIWFLTHLTYIIIFTLVVTNNSALVSDWIADYVLQAIIAAGAIGMVCWELVDILNIRMAYFTEAGSRIFYLLSWSYSILILGIVIARYATYNYLAESILLPIAAIFLYSYLFYFARGIRPIGYLVVIIREIILGDLIKFLGIYVVMMAGFVVSFMVMYQPTANADFSSFASAMLSMFQAMLTSFESFNNFDDVLSRGFAAALFVGYNVLVTIMLLNLLIAMINSTFIRIQEQARLQWKLEWSSIILLIERRLLPIPGSRRRSGRVGTDLGLNDQRHFIILEEIIEAEENQATISRAGAGATAPRLVSVVDEVLKRRKVASKVASVAHHHADAAPAAAAE